MMMTGPWPDMDQGGWESPRPSGTHHNSSRSSLFVDLTFPMPNVLLHARTYLRIGSRLGVATL